MKPRKTQLATSGPKVSKLKTLMAVAWLELLQERWISVFGRMHTLRTDPEGAWRNKEVHERLSDMQIDLDLHPKEGIVANVGYGKHHWNCERDDDENRVGEGLI